jgi:hypothetical protein
MTQIEQAYLAGFMASAEGYNGEYGSDTNAPSWLRDRDNALAALRAQPDHSELVLGLLAQNAALLDALKAVKVAAVYCSDGAFSVSGETMRCVVKAIALAEGKDV